MLFRSYNLNSGGTWSASNSTNPSNNRYIAYWICATTQANNPIISIMGQSIDSSLLQAQNNNAWGNLNLSGLPIVELRPLYRLIYDTRSTFSNTPKGFLVDILDIRSHIGVVTGVVQNDHGNLYGLADDDHSQYVHIDNARTVSAVHTFANGFNAGNLSINNSNTISSNNSNGNIVLAPSGTGDVQIDADTLRVGDSNTNATITTNGTGDLILNTNSGTNSGSITIQDGTTGNIIITPGSTNSYIQNHTNSLIYKVSRTTTNNSSTTLTTDGNSPGANNRLVIPAKTSWVFTVNISAYNETANEANGWIFRGVIGRDNSNNTTFVGDPIEENWISDIASSASVVVDDTNEALQIDVVGISSETIKWVGIVTLTQITGA